jgi:NHL repeat
MKGCARVLVVVGSLAAMVVGCGPTEVVVGEAQGVARVVAGVLGVSHQLTVPDDAPPGPATAQSIGSPAGIAAADDGSFFFVDRFRRRVGAVTADGELTWPVGRGVCGTFTTSGTTPETLCLQEPFDIVRDTDGTFLLADRGAHRVYRVDLAADKVSVVLGTGQAGVAADGDAAATAPTNRPVSVVIGPDGAAYVAESGNQRVVCIRPDGSVAVVAGRAGDAADTGDDGPAADARLMGPSGLAWMGDTLFIADGGANRIRRIINDTIHAYAGLGAPGFAGDRGSATSALFRDPGAMTVIGSLLLVADRGNFRVRIIQVGPDSIDTFAGTGDSRPGPDELDVGRTAIDGPTGIAAAGRAVFLSDSGGYVVRRVIR